MYHRLKIAALLCVLVIALAAPITAWADAPAPPRNPFQAPPTATPAPLRAPPTPRPPTPTVQPERDDPGEQESKVFLPFVSRAEVIQLAQPTSVPTIRPTAAPPMEREHDPFAERFVHVMRADETLSDLAIDFGRDMRTMSCVRDEEGKAIAKLEPGQRVVIPAMSDLCHRVKTGETLEKIADWYGVSVESLLAVPQNQLEEAEDVRVGQYLLIPNARSRYRDPSEVSIPRPLINGWFYGDGDFVWPIERESTWLSQSFKHGKHMAIDLATKQGTKVMAVDTGVVLKAGWNDSGYGYRVVLDHGIDYITLYAHLAEYYVKPGEIVQKGDVIGAVGSTGNSTGPHLHFEVRDYGYLVDPLLVLD